MQFARISLALSRSIWAGSCFSGAARLKDRGAKGFMETLNGVKAANSSSGGILSPSSAALQIAKSDQ